MENYCVVCKKCIFVLIRIRARTTKSTRITRLALGNILNRFAHTHIHTFSTEKNERHQSKRLREASSTTVAEGAKIFISAAGNYRRHCKKIASKICHECHINFMRFVMQCNDDGPRSKRPSQKLLNKD